MRSLGLSITNIINKLYGISKIMVEEELASPEAHWMWVRVAGPPRQRIILFGYDPSRGHEVAERLLDGAHGTIQSDGSPRLRSSGEEIRPHP
jgi:hypothetical protein